MTELVLDIKDDSLLPILKKVIKAFPGIRIRMPKKKADPTLMTKKEFFDKIDASKKQWEEGKYHSMLPGENLTDFLDRVRP